MSDYLTEDEATAPLAPWHAMTAFVGALEKQFGPSGIDAVHTLFPRNDYLDGTSYAGVIAEALR